ncbi:hypothetical protein E4695_02240 [Alcaligenaceae bacterium 429]|nr:hypothetical protein E4695_02240 [Alcaligenaceae bacterium 429]
MIVVNIIRNVLEPTQIARHETDDLIGLLRSEFGSRAPVGARLYNQYISDYTDVTPTSKEAEEALASLDGPFWLVIEPQGPEVWIPLAISAVLSVASMMLFQTKIPNVAQRNVNAESPNNGLSARANRERVNGRIPDIFGTVRSTPDLLSVPYLIFDNHVEKEVAYMCVGRGSFEVHDVREDETPVAQIAGMSVEVYGPNTSPNSGAPQLRIGNAINTPVLSVKRTSSVNGQTLLAPNWARLVHSPMVFEYPNIIRSDDPSTDFSELFVSGDVIAVSGASVSQGLFTYSHPIDVSADKAGPRSGPGTLRFPEVDLSDRFEAGQVVEITNGYFVWSYVSGAGDTDGTVTRSTIINGIYSVIGVSVSWNQGVPTSTISFDIVGNENLWPYPHEGLNPSIATGNPILSRPSGEVLYDLSGSYSIDTITANEIRLSNPEAVNPDWLVLRDEHGGITPSIRATVQAQAERWIGWMLVESLDAPDQLIANFLALNGLYLDNGRQQYRTDVGIELQAQAVDEQGNPFGALHSLSTTVIGSATSRSTRALTGRLNLTETSRRWRIRARRTSDSNTSFEGSVVDEIKWRDLYVAKQVTEPHFGDVTTVQSVTMATEGALAAKERKLNLLVTRLIPRRESGGFSASLHSSNSAADILCAVALDPRIGNREVGELDIDGIYATHEDIVDYFGFSEAGDFSYTFDKAEMSFEETFQAIASAVFCQAYRRGSRLRLFFERETDESVLLFNHRNTLPGSESRAFSFGPKEGYDGVQYEYVSPDDDAVLTIYLPNMGAINPQKVESVGVRSHRQAMVHAWRAWNKIQHKHTTMERDCLGEADLLVLGQRIRCSDTTRAGEQGGYIMAVEGLVVRLSQPMDWSQTGPHMMFVQNSDGQTEGIPVVSGGNEFTAVLSRAPRVPIVTASAQPTGYIIGSGEEQRQAQPFILTSKEQIDGHNVRISAINYASEYYSKDGMYRQ